MNIDNYIVSFEPTPDQMEKSIRGLHFHQITFHILTNYIEIKMSVS